MKVLPKGKTREREREPELVSITDNSAFIPYDDFLYRIHLPNGGEFCFPTNDHGITPIGKVPWADTSKSSSKKAFIDNIHISNTYPNNFTFTYERQVFYKGVDNMISTLCDIHGVSKPEVFTFVLLNRRKKLLLLRERILYGGKSHLNTFDLFRLNTKKLKSTYYFLGYFLSGKMYELKKVRFEDFTYDFSIFSRKIL